MQIGERTRGRVGSRSLAVGRKCIIHAAAAPIADRESEEEEEEISDM